MTNNTIKHLGIVENIQGSHLFGEDRSDIGLRGLQREGTLFLGRQQGQNHRYN